MGFKREEIRDWSALSLKKLNDNIRNLWLHSFGNIGFGDLNTKFQSWIKNTDVEITNRVTKTQYEQDIQTLQNQIDGVQYSWFYAYVPTLTNAPAVDWTTDALKDEHIGDTFTDTTVDGNGNSTGYSYRFLKNGTTYEWAKITDTEATQALQTAGKAQDTADSKRRVFVVTPYVPYDVGDLWTEGATGNLYRCKTAKAAGGTYSISDWEYASKYTDDSYAKAVESALGQRLDSAESKITPTAIVSTVRTSTEYKNDLGQKITSSQATTIAQTASNVKIGFNGISDKVTIDTTGITIKAGGFNLAASDGSVSGWFSDDGSGFSKMKVGELTAGNVLTTQAATIALYVDGTSGNDNNTGASGSRLKTINEALRRVNKIIKSEIEVNIYVYGTCAENVTIENFQGSGTLKILLDVNCTVQGSFVVTGCNAFINIEGGRDAVNSSVLGALITPQYGKPALEAVNCNTVQMYGVRAKMNSANGFVWNRSNGLCIYNDISGCNGNSAICAQNCATVFNYGNRGSNNAYSYWVYYGGIIIGGNSASPVSANGIANDGGSIQTGTLTGTETQDASSRPGTQTYTTQWTATQTDSWRPSGWRSDNNYVYQGEYSGYGQHRGFMCFNSASIRSILSGATINSVRIYMVRQNGGGSSAAQSLHWYGHGYDNTGGGYDLSVDFGYSGSLSWGQGAWIGLSTTIGNYFRDNNIHGLALYDGSSNYLTCTNMPILEITYTK